MTMFVFAALTAIAFAIGWATVAVASRQSPQEQGTVEEGRPESGWFITPTHVRLC